jgi:hypothetical protein
MYYHRRGSVGEIDPLLAIAGIWYSGDAMTHALLVCALLHAPPPAMKPKVKDRALTLRAKHADGEGGLALAHASAAERRTFDLQGAFERAMGSAGLGISSGKLVIKRPGTDEDLGLALRGARLTPLFDVSTSGASAHLRISF